MARRNRNDSARAGRAKHGTGATPIAAAIGFFAIVLGAVYFAANRATTPTSAKKDRSIARTEAAHTPIVTVPSVNSRSKEIPDLPHAAAGTLPEPADASGVPKSHTPTEGFVGLEPQPSDADPAEARLQKVKAQLAAGEFGPALGTAQQAINAKERTRLLKLVADAQMQAGEFDAALRAIRRIPIAQQRNRARSERASRRSLAGGSQADFEPLKELIMQQTSGLWEEEAGDGGTMSDFPTGVRVDPNGMLFRLSRQEQTGRLKALGIQARLADLNEDMARTSSLRLVSLTRLEKAVAQRIADGLPVVETMKHLAGLSQIRYLFVYPEEGEIVLGGPAEGWRYNEKGLPVGVDSGRPTLQLDDLVTVMRTFSPDGLGMFQCLIVPRRENMRKVNAYAKKSQARGPLSAAGVRRWVRRMQERLGVQDVKVNGVPPESRVARVIVEADYRMKLIGIDKLDEGYHIPSFFDLLTDEEQNAGVNLSANRWWMTMKYNAVLHSPDRNVFEIRGSSVLCRAEDELITPDGTRIHTGKASKTNQLFAQYFTNSYQKLAERDLVFGDLQNIFDLSLVAALIRHERLGDRVVNWDLGVFAQNGGYRPARYEPARTVMSVANHRKYKGGAVIAQVAGGVRADLMAVVTDRNVVREVSRLANFAARGRAPELPQGRWWWDAAN